MLKITDAGGVVYEIEYSPYDQVRNLILRHIEHLEQQLSAERERADFAWQNTRIIEKARQEEMRKRDAEREACAKILNLSRSECLLMAGEMTSQEWRTVSAVLIALHKLSFVQNHDKFTTPPSLPVAASLPLMAQGVTDAALHCPPRVPDIHGRDAVA